MTLPSSPNSISFSQIEAEFGQSTNRKLGDYRKKTTLGGKDWPIDDNVPTSVAIGSSQIAFSDFCGKQHNIVALMQGTTAYRLTASTHLSSLTSTAFRGTGPSVRRESKNIVYVNRVIGSDKSSENTEEEKRKSALRTGTSADWYGNLGVDGGKVLIRISPNGKVIGAGGDGGKGGDHEAAGNDGDVGTSALGIELFVESVTVESGGIIQAGSGGGAGGGGAKEDSETERVATGGGGGGGAGLPAGSGGGLRTPSSPNFTVNNNSGSGVAATAGNNGTQNEGGNGGLGGENDGEAHGGGGGGGGAFGSSLVGVGGEGGLNNSKTDGQNGETNNSIGNGKGGEGGNGDDEGDGGAGEQGGGEGGDPGYAITRGVGISAPTVVGNVVGQQGAFGVS